MLQCDRQESATDSDICRVPQRWRALYEEFGEDGLRPLDRGRSQWKACDAVLAALAALVDSSPEDHGYLRSRWSSELLAMELQPSKPFSAARDGFSINAAVGCEARERGKLERVCRYMARPPIAEVRPHRHSIHSA